MKTFRLSASALVLASLAGSLGHLGAQQLASFQASGQVFSAAQAPATAADAAPAPAPAQGVTISAPSDRVILQFRQETDIVGGTVVLGDLVASDKPLPADLAAIPIAVAPAFNTSRIVSRNAVEGVLLGHPEFRSYSLIGVDSCMVKRPGRTVSAAELPAVLLPEIQRATQGAGDVKIEEVARIQGGMIPAGRIGAQVQLGDGALNHTWGTATVRYYSGTGELVGTSTVSFRWSWQRTAWIALRPISPGEEYNPIDFRETAVDGIKLGTNFVDKLPDPGELVAARLIPVGTVLVPNALAPKKIVQKGKNVTVTYNQNHVKISMRGLCLQDGARGEVIPVRNMNSQKTIYAKVVGEQELEIVQ
ncbi:flagella basal body P-ring formation protein FlgA [Verrucomicrobium sp. GAS474]|uniref:flagellar basal body P-ring formation chaperone FlgA n=1 Tax=Verrucomicrobium sp. GAS474 TaxID=1882831 RepID=UPI00087CAAC9|nr:flagellar basal body P-ring formation chaperone FlgA [Verrucomicrobium sp. GAS474]SDU24677.1 flagella basal body P-ring formation protein FlgA [Verrucomicrobium sp. GAS474]